MTNNRAWSRRENRDTQAAVAVDQLQHLSPRVAPHTLKASVGTRRSSSSNDRPLPVVESENLPPAVDAQVGWPPVAWEREVGSLNPVHHFLLSVSDLV